MADIEITWDLPTERQSGGPLDLNDIDYTAVEISADGGTNYTEIDRVPRASDQRFVQTEVEAGTWLFRLAVYDTAGERGAAHVESVDIADETPPAAVMNVTVNIT